MTKDNKKNLMTILEKLLGGRVMITQKFKCCLPKPKENYLTV